MSPRVHRRLASALRSLTDSNHVRRTQMAEDLAISELWRMWPDRSGNPLTAVPRRHWSQSDEDGIIEQILDRLMPGQLGTFIEFGVGDGTENNTVALLARGWSGGWAGSQPLAFEPHPGGRLAFHRTWLTLDNVEDVMSNLLEEVGGDSPDLVSMDLDGNDFHLTQRLLTGGIRPKVWVAEFNGRFPPESHWVMPYAADHVWRGDDYHGASFASMCDLFEDHGYRLVACSVSGVNAFFVRSDLAAVFSDVPTHRLELYQPPCYAIPRSLMHPASPITLRSLTAPLPGHG